MFQIYFWRSNPIFSLFFWYVIPQMADEIVYKKVSRKADRLLEGKVIAKHSRQTNQKLKPYVVLQYLLKYSDENNVKSAYDIIGYLENCGISAERRSIYRDIKDINRIIRLIKTPCLKDVKKE